MPRPTPSPEPPRLRKEYLVLLLVIVLVSIALVRWCGPGIREALSSPYHGERAAPTQLQRKGAASTQLFDVRD